MLWSSPRLRRPRNIEIQQRVAEARRQTPESETWLGLLEAALAESEDGVVWDAAVATPATERPVKAPLLARAHIAVGGRAARDWVRSLVKRAGAANGAGRRLDALALLEAAVCQDDARVDALTGAEGAVLRVLGQMAVWPLLQACARKLEQELPATWWEGYCPLCGAWPVVAEYSGLERQRRLRCGRCGTGWAIPSLRCVFCDETHHDHLGYLTPEAGDQMRKIEICNSCHGYLKALTTIRPLAPWAVPLDDLMTVHLDVAALERGYHRPERPGYALEAQVAAA